MSSSRLLPDRAVLRSARRSDLPFLVSLSKQAFAPWARNPSGALARMMRDGTTLVAEHTLGGRAIPLGFAIVEVSSAYATVGELRAPRLAHLSAIAVRPEATRCGIGRQLLESAEEAAREQGAVAMSLLTAKTNLAAQGLFRRAGYQPILPIEGAYVDDQDGIRMLRSLSLPVAR